MIKIKYHNPNFNLQAVLFFKYQVKVLGYTVKTAKENTDLLASGEIIEMTFRNDADIEKFENYRADIGMEKFVNS